MLKLVNFQDPILTRKSRHLMAEEIHTSQMQQFFDEILAFSRGEQGDQNKHVLVGLAAPQVGRDVRVIVVDLMANGKGGIGDARLYINPEIIEHSEDTEEWYEGCYSTGHVKGIVRRPSRVTIRALDRMGHELMENHLGYVARIFQHEIDHLDGIRFPDRVPDSEPLHVVKTEEMPSYRNGEQWRAWKNTIPHANWQAHQ